MKKTVKELVKELRDEGHTFAEIGELMGMSRQRAHQHYHDKQH